MKKMVLIVVGLIVVIGAGVLISRERTQGSQETESVETTVSQAARLPGADESRRAGGGTAQGPALRGDTVVASDGDVASTREALSEAVKALLGQDGK